MVIGDEARWKALVKWSQDYLTETERVYNKYYPEYRFRVYDDPRQPKWNRVDHARTLGKHEASLNEVKNFRAIIKRLEDWEPPTATIPKGY